MIRGGVDLEAGDKVVTVQSITKVDGPQRVYNLEVASLDGQITHNYFVGEDEIWTHNLTFQGPSRRNGGRIFGIRRGGPTGRKNNVFRLDFNPIPGSCGRRVLHVHIGKGGDKRHIPVNPFKRF